MSVASLVSTEWLAEHLEAPDVRVVDGSWHMPQLKREARTEFEDGHIPGAVFFDIDGIADDAVARDGDEGVERVIPLGLPTATDVDEAGARWRRQHKRQ